MTLLAASSFGQTIITAAAGLVGVALGGLISGYVALRAERTRQRFAQESERRSAEQERARERAAARGVARTVYEHFRTAQLFLGTAAERRAWWSAQDRLTLNISQEDRKALAGMMSPAAWAAVVRADFAIQRLLALRESAGATRGSVAQWDRRVDEFRSAAETIGEALRAIAALAGDPDRRAVEPGPSSRAADGDSFALAMLAANMQSVLGEEGPLRPAGAPAVLSPGQGSSGLPADDQGAGIALCLSGGGYRSMLFHLGTLWRLNEAAYLPRISQYCSVSAGSLCTAMLGLQWDRLAFDAAGRALELEAEVVVPLRRLAGRTIDLPAALRGTLVPWSGRNEQFAKVLRRALFADRTLQDLPDAPRFVFVASNLTSGAVWRFSKATSGDWRTGTVRSPTTDVATVVAASAALLPLLSPATLRLRPEDLHAVVPSLAAVRGDVELTDGGIYDNLAVETAWRTSGTVLASDGRGAAMMGGGGHRLTSQIAQATAGLSRQSLTLRRRQLVSGFQTGIRRGAYWNIGASIDRYAERALDLAVPPAAAASLSRLPTRYAATSSVTQERLINLGYALCDAALRTHVDHDLAAPEGLPYPTAGI